MVVEAGCTLCPRACGAARYKGEKGYCGADSKMLIARASLHMWEEPCISGRNGSGTVFFSHCPLRCIFCQNHELSWDGVGTEVTVAELTTILLDLQMQGAHNINLVTGTHYAFEIRDAIIEARSKGLAIPVVWNTSAFETTATLRLLSDVVDVFLPDLKFISEDLAERYSRTPSYPRVATKAILEMNRIVGSAARLNDDGLMTSGLIVRHLVLPGHTKEAMRVLDWIADNLGTGTYVSLMSQYTPGYTDDPAAPTRRLSAREYDKVVDHLINLGFEHGYLQELSSATRAYTPAFDGTGVPRAPK